METQVNLTAEEIDKAILATHYETMVKDLAKDGSVMLSEITPQEIHELHMAFGIGGELAELLLPLTAYSIIGGEPDRENIVEELGDYEFYAEGERSSRGITREQTLAAYDGHISSVHGMEEVLAERDISDKAMGASMAALYGAMAVVAAGDVMDAVKRVAIYRKAYDEHALLIAFGRVEACLIGIRDVFSITREETLDHNKRKLLTKRYKGGKYTDVAAQTRADKVEVVTSGETTAQIGQKVAECDELVAVAD